MFRVIAVTFRWHNSSFGFAALSQIGGHVFLPSSQIGCIWGARGVFEDKGDRSASEAAAWDKLEKDGWELVSVVADAEGKLVPFFKRATGAGKK